MNKLFLIILLIFVIFLTSCSLNQEDDEKIIEETPKEKQEDMPAKIIPPVYSYETPLIHKPIFKSLNLKSVNAKKISEILSRIAPDSVAVEGDRGNSLILRGKASDISDIKNLIDVIDSPTPQIMIESKIVEISESRLKKLGFNWENNLGSLKVAINPEDKKVTPDNITASLNAFISSGEAKVLASPRISTLDNNEAEVKIGSKIPYAVPVNQSSSSTKWAVQYIDAGISLKITPRIGEDGLITVDILPEVSTISEWRNTSAGEFPVISTRNAHTLIRVKNGQTIIIGGLIDETFRENISKIPGLSDIPLINPFFTNKTSEKTKTEIVFMITPYIMQQ